MKVYNLSEESRSDRKKCTDPNSKKPKSKKPNNIKPNSKKAICVNPKYIKALTVVLALLMVFAYLYHPMDQSVHICFLDVGQGDSIVIRNGRSGFIIDGGGDRYMKDDFNKGKEVVIPFLMEEGIRKLDCAFVTHTDYDHIKGILEIMGNVPIGTIVLAKPYEGLLGYQGEEEQGQDRFLQEGDEEDLLRQLLDKAADLGIPVRYMEAGDRILCEPLTFTCVYPAKGQVHSELENNNSLVLRLDCYDFSCLLTGDVEGGGELWMVDNQPLIENVSILKVPHHGSNSSSTESFIEKTNPQAGLVSVGKNNYGHPSDIIRLRYKNFEIPLYTTQKYGMIEIAVNEDGYRLQSFKGVLQDEAVKSTVKE